MAFKKFCFLFFLLAFAFQASALNFGPINYSPAPAEPGKYVLLWAQLDNNTSYDAEQVKFSLGLKYPFSLDPTDSGERNIGTIKIGQSVQLRYDIRVDGAAVDGNYDIDLQFSEKATGGLTVTKSTKVRVVSTAPKVEIIKSSVVRARPGEDIETALTLKNIGKSAALNVVVEVKDDRTVSTTGVVVERDVLPLGSAKNYIEKLLPEEEKELVLGFGTNSDVKLKVYTVPLRISYSNEIGNAFSAETRLGFRIFSEPELDSVMTTTKPLPYPGGSSEISFDVFNIGPASVRFAVVEIESEVAEISEPKQFIGSLDADDYDSFKATFKIKQGTKPGSYPVKLRFSMKNEENKDVTIEKTVMLKVVSEQESAAASGQQGSILGTVVIVVIIAAAVFFVWRHRRKKHIRQ